MKTLLSLIILLTISSCSLAPFSSENSARSYGAGQMAAEVGNTNSSYFIKYGMGITEAFDAGLVMEFGGISTTALFTKYSFINNQTGPSLAMDFGYGSADQTKFYYIGTIGSLAFTEEFEIFTGIRFNSVSTDEKDVEKDEFNGNVKILAYDVNYLQLSYGFNVWFSKMSGLSLYLTHYRADDIETNQDATFTASLMFRF